MAPVKTGYSKNWLSLSDQVRKLQSRGLIVDDIATAVDYLGHVNYYRFSGYCLAFHRTGCQLFRPNIRFSDVAYAHDFDAQLRSLVADWLQVAELDLRTRTAHFFGERYGAFGHCDYRNFNRRFSPRVPHADWLKRLQEDTDRSRKERFVEHFHRKYSQWPDLPIWTVMEVMTFGSLARMIGGMTKADRRDLGLQYDFSPEVMASVALHLNYIRNVCAHHSRLWERLHQIKPVLPNGPDWSTIRVDNQRLFASLLLLRKITTRIGMTRDQSDRFRDKVENLLDNPPNVHRPGDRMGLPMNWKQHPVWR